VESTKVEFIEAESRMMVVRGWMCGGMGKILNKVCRLSVVR
jgi:hypothetical protein